MKEFLKFTFSGDESSSRESHCFRSYRPSTLKRRKDRLAESKISSVEIESRGGWGSSGSLEGNLSERIEKKYPKVISTCRLRVPG